MLNDGQLLGAVPLACAAGDTVCRAAEFLGQGAVGVHHLPALGGAAGVVIEQAEILGNSDLFGAVGSAVIAGGAGDGGVLPDDLGGTSQRFQLLLRQRLHLTQVVLQVLTDS